MATGHEPNSPGHDAIAIVGRTMTADELLLLPESAGRVELVDGKVRCMSPTVFGHGAAVSRLNRLLDVFVEANRLGAVCGGDVGFVLARNPDTVLAPDVAYLRTERIPTENALKFVDGPPDLAIEVNSPGDRKGEIAAKTKLWLAAGARAVWNVNLQTKTVTVHIAGQPTRTYAEGGTLDGGVVLPGFACEVRRIFEV